MVDMGDADTEILGTGFILLDVTYIIHSLICLVAVARAVWNAASNKEVHEENAATRGVSVHPVSRDRDLEKVEEIEQNSQNYRNLAVHNIIQRISKRRSSLELRVQARKKVKQFNALLKSECFSNLEPASISKIIDEMEFLVIKENNYDMCRQGDNAKIFYIIVSGACQVILDGNPVAMLGEMDIFGESALFTDGQGRSRRGATVTTINDEKEDVQVLALSRKKFNKLIASGDLNEDCVNKLKLVAEKRKKENEQKNRVKPSRTTTSELREEKGVKMEKQVGKKKTDGGSETAVVARTVENPRQEGATPTKMTNASVEKIRLTMKRLMKTRGRLQNWMDHGDKTSSGFLSRKYFEKVVRKVVQKVAPQQVKERFMELMWVSVKAGSGHGVARDVVEQEVVERWVFGEVAKST